jgi:signal transduction histidine kinase/ActR/RegA family two-component response regulator
MATADRTGPRADAARLAQIRAFQVRMLYRGVPQSTLASLSAAFLLALAMVDAVSGRLVVLWFGAMCLHQALRRIDYLRYMRTQKNPPCPEQAPRWGRRFVLSASIAGGLWGLAPVLLYVPDSLGHQAVLSAVVYGVCATSAAAIGAYTPAFLGFVSAMMLPFILRMASVGDADHGYLAVAGLMVLASVLIFGRNINQVIRRSIALRYRNEDLIDALSRQSKVADAARLEAENADRAKSRFLAAASHDLRQPLHALGLFAAALHERTKEPETQAMVGSINQSVEALDRLFDELLDISRLDAGAVEPHLEHLPLAPMLDRIRLDFDGAAGEKGLRLSVRNSALWVYSDAMLLERIIRNLAANAVRYTDKGGIIVACRQRRDAVQIEVWDSGVGIAPDQREQIFEEFYQVGNPGGHSGRGLGLGLAIVRRLADLLGYPVTLRSQPARGSKFSLRVPLGRKPLQGLSRAAPANAAEPVAGKLILVIDDEIAIIEGMQAALSAWGCEVATGTSAEAALAALGEVERYPDLMVADYRLQGTETGLDAIARVRRELGFPVPAVLITGTTADDELQAGAAAIGCEILHKPVIAQDLRRRIAAALAHTGPGSA